MIENPENAKVYKDISDLHSYVQKLMENGAPIIIASKTARIAARPGVAGEKIISWSADSCGNPIIEKEATVSEDAKPGVTEWVVTKIDEHLEEMIDQNGHKNQYIIADSTFQKKYEEDPEHPGIYKPAGKPQKFVRLSEAIHTLQWGEEWHVDAGGYINITNESDYYCVSGRDFNDLYQIEG